MRAVRAAFVAILMSVAYVVWPPAAHAADGERITDFSMDYAVQTNGSVQVTEHITYQFAGDSSHGIKRAIVTEQGYDNDRVRRYAMSGVSATSPTGAPADVNVSDEGSVTTIRIGSPDRTVSGTQKYDVRYTLGHVVNKQSKDGQSWVELYWNVLGTLTAVPVDKASVTLTGPAAVSRTDCFVGAFESKKQCTSAPGAKATFSASGLQPYEGMTIVGAFPSGSITDVQPQLEQASSQDWNPSSDGGNGPFGQGDDLPAGVRTAGTIGAVAIPAAAAALMGLLFWRRGRDERFAGVTPGLTPLPGQDDTVVRGRGGPVAVQFEPPKGVQPGLMGTVIDGDAGAVDVSATVVDLAVRGYLRMEEIERGNFFSRADWQLTQLKDIDGSLAPYEAEVMRGLFDDGPVVQLSQLRNHFASTLRKTQSMMYDETVLRGWYRKSPQSTRAAFTGFGFLLFMAAAFTFIHLPALGIGLAVAGGIVALTGRRMSARTALGSAVVDQSLGFRKYLETAEAQQFKFEEAEQIFSRYMPYAVVFGLAKKWADTFGEVARAAEAAGQPMIMPMWYIPIGGGWNDFDSIGTGLDDFGTTASGTFSSTPGSATPGSIGSSGFGGGGFSGGGGGGGGTSSW